MRTGRTSPLDAALFVGEHRDDGRCERFVRRRRHYLPAEAASLLAAAGLALCGAWCAYDLALPYGARDEGMVLAARRSS